MLKFALCFLFGTLALAQNQYRLCTYSKEDYAKCTHTVHVANVDVNPLPLQCLQMDDLENCISSISDGNGDMTVLAGQDYKAASNKGLRPVLFAREDDSNLSIVVASKNITVIELQEAPIYLKNKNDGSFHAALFFNRQRGHEICDTTNIDVGSPIRIEDSASYQSNDDEILICADRSPSEFANYQDCNVEASLQRAVFVKSTVSDEQIQEMKQLFESIQARFGPNSPSSRYVNRHGFNFFAPFLDGEDLIFKDDTTAFDLQPTLRNGIDADVFSQLQCNNDQPHE